MKPLDQMTLPRCAFREDARRSSRTGEELIVVGFAGGGGTCYGIESALGRAPDIAINHDPDSIEMHRLNHPATRHFCEDIFHVDPLKATRGRAVGLAWYSPDCRHFSRAKGGKPVEKKIRGLARVVVKWAKQQDRPRIIMLENVREFQDWGPLDANHKPDPKRKGQTFLKWVACLRNLGYVVEWRVLNAADYGAPTHRRRLFVVARRDGRPVVWPEKTHGKCTLRSSGVSSGDSAGLDGAIRPLRPGQRRRRAGGRLVQKDCPEKRPVAGCADRRDEEAGLSDLGSGQSRLKPYRTAASCIDWSIPCPSIFSRTRPLKPKTLRRIAMGLKRYVIDRPDPFIIHLTHDGLRPVHPVTDPAPTVTGANRGELGLVTPFLAKHYGGVVGHGLDRPVGTVTAVDHHSLVTPYLVGAGGRSPDPREVDRPAGTVLPKDQPSLIAPILTQLRGSNNGNGGDVDQPCPAITSRDRFGLVAAFLREHGIDCGDPPTVTIHGVPYIIADIGMRMLQPRELARCQGFPESYLLTGTKSNQVAKIGNSVSPPCAAALVAANCGDLRRDRRAA